MSKQKNSELPILADLKPIKLPFYDLIDIIMPPSTLLFSGNGIATSVHNFSLTSKQLAEINRNRIMSKPGLIEYEVQVQLRLCRCDGAHEQHDSYPTDLQIKVNDKDVALPPPLPTRPGQPIKRQHLPFDITNHIKGTTTASNKIHIKWKAESSQNFAVTLHLVRKLDSKILLKRLSAKGIKPEDFTRGVIKEKFQMEDGDNEIKTVHLRVSLACPLGKMRMILPCRASTCTHLQCFDANNFLHMNERKASWKCPVCDQPALFDNLLIDGYFLDVLNSPKLASDENEILLHKDGSWSTFSSKSDVKMEMETNEEKNVLELSSDEEDVKPAMKEEPIMKQEGDKKDVPKKKTSRTGLRSSKNEETSTTPPVRKRQPPRAASTRSVPPKRAKKDEVTETPPTNANGTNGSSPTDSRLTIDLTADDDE